MKKILTIVLAFVLLFTVASCSKSNYKNEETKPPVSDEQKPSEEYTDVQFPSKFKSGRTISFSCPKGWDIEDGVYSPEGPDKTVNQSSPFVKIKPKGEEGYITIFTDYFFGVCGTGLKTEKITIDGHNATKGTYDENEVWDFIVLEDEYSDCAIQNNGAEWITKYNDDVEKILDSLSFSKKRTGEDDDKTAGESSIEQNSTKLVETTEADSSHKETTVSTSVKHSDITSKKADKSETAKESTSKPDNLQNYENCNRMICVVKSIEGSIITAARLDGEKETQSLYNINYSKFDNLSKTSFSVGEKIEVLYNDPIAESYPYQIPYLVDVRSVG